MIERARWVVFALLVSLGFQETSTASEVSKDAAGIFELAGVRGGFVVHLGSGDGQLTAALRVSESFQVQGLATDITQVATAREAIRRAGVYGNVSVIGFSG